MSEKDLVLDEPIATGWAHKQFSGDEEKAKGYMTAARSLLGAMKARYGVNDRIAAGDPGGFYFHQQQLPDGTLIEVTTNDGQDSMRITASSQVQKSPVETNEQGIGAVKVDVPVAQIPHISAETGRKLVSGSQKVPVPDVLICGSCDDGTNLHPTAWGFSKGPLDLGALLGCTTGEALAISADGETIVGYSRGVGTLAFRWDQKNGMRALGEVGDDNYAIATDVSEDGSVICGICGNNDGTYSAWRWTEADGFAILPDLGFGTPIVGVPTNSVRANGLRYDITPSISPNGKYIVASVVRREPQQVYVGVVWVGNQLFEIPIPGTTTTPYGIHVDGDPSPAQPGLSGPLQDGDQSMPVSVTDDGLVAGYSTHLTMVTTTYHAEYNDGIGPPDQFPLVINPLSPQTAFLWNIGASECTYINDGDAAAVANDSATIAGNSNSGPLNTRVTTEVFHHIDGRPDTIVTTTYQAYDDNTLHGWFLDDGKPEVSLGGWTSAYDVSDDGEVIVGSAQNDADSQPAMWDLSGTRAVLTLLALVPGTTRGWATSVATISTDVDIYAYEYEYEV